MNEIIFKGVKKRKDSQKFKYTKAVLVSILTYFKRSVPYHNHITLELSANHDGFKVSHVINSCHDKPERKLKL